MIILDLAYWNLRWRPWRELVHLHKKLARPAQKGRKMRDDALLGELPNELLTARGDWLD